MNAAVTFSVLLLPGWLDSGPGHWQTQWEHIHGDQRVVQHDYQRPRRGDWMARLDEVLADRAASRMAPVVLVAHSLGCHLVAAWAAHSQHTSQVSGALLVAPPDPRQSDWPIDLAGWREPVLKRLPFAAHVVISTNDPFGCEAAQLDLAQAWGAQAHVLGDLGHINGESGLGAWPQGRAWVAQLSPTSQRPS